VLCEKSESCLKLVDKRTQPAALAAETWLVKLHMRILNFTVTLRNPLINNLPWNIRRLNLWADLSLWKSGESQRLPKRRDSYFLDNRLRDGGEVVSLTCRPPFTLRKIKIPGICFR
jgi:hypothetical protein